MSKNQSFIELAPWEFEKSAFSTTSYPVESIAPPISPFQTPLLMARVGASPHENLCFCPENQQGTFWVAGRSSFANLDAFCVPGEAWNEAQDFSAQDFSLLQSVKWAIANGHFGRIFYLYSQEEASDFGGDWRLFLAANGWGAWTRLSGAENIFFGRLAPFRWSQEHQIQLFAQNDALELLKEVRPVLKEPQGQPALAREWLGRNPQSQRPYVAWKNGGQSQWQRVVDLVLRSDTSLWEGRSEIVAMLVFSFPFREGSAELTLLDEKDQNVPPSDFVAHWNKAILLFFVPHIAKPYTNYQLASYWQGGYYSVGVECSHAPTAHEIIEATLELREWAHQNLPSETVAALFPKPLD